MKFMCYTLRFSPSHSGGYARTVFSTERFLRECLRRFHTTSGQIFNTLIAATPPYIFFSQTETPPYPYCSSSLSSYP